MKKKSWGFDTKMIDTNIRPQDDFFHYAAGGWLKKNPIPKTESKWGTFYILRNEGLKRTNALFKELVKKKNLKKGSEAQIIQDFYISGMDMKKRNTLGIQPITPLLTEIEKIDTHEKMLSFLFNSHKKGLSFLWHVFVGQDDKDSETYITHLSQGGLSLPDRDFYLKNDPKSQHIRKEFKIYVSKVFKVLGDTPSQAQKNAEDILAFETKLARASMDKVRRREVKHVYNKRTLQQLSKNAPYIPWKKYFLFIGIEPKQVILMQPEFFKKMDALVHNVPLSLLKTYFRFSVADASAPYLSRTWIMLQFSFYGKVLSGTKEIRPEWKRVSSSLDSHIGEAIGKEYVKRYFPTSAKKKIDELVDDLFAAYEKRIKNLDWMSPATKKKSLQKLSAITRKLGYPEKWQSYTGLVIKPDTYFENILRSNAYEERRMFKKLGKKVDRKEWFTPPQTVNAFYSPNMNEIVFPAGILQPPFFDPNADDAINYGAIGSVIGHELTHGFDDEGSKFDGKGNYKNWWTKQDRKRFDAKTKVLVDQFNSYRVGDLQVNGKLTLGENIADLGGLVMAYDAYMHRLARTGRKNIDGFSPEQRFFLGLALFEAAHERPEYARMLVLVDPHSPTLFRVNGPMSNLTEFYEAFDVKEKHALYRKPIERAQIW